MTVTGTVSQADGTPYVGVISFIPLRTPMFSAAGQMMRGESIRTQTDEDGNFSQVLNAGIYDVPLPPDVQTQNHRTSFQIRVRNTNDTADWSVIVHGPMPNASDFGVIT